MLNDRPIPMICDLLCVKGTPDLLYFYIKTSEMSSTSCIICTYSQVNCGSAPFGLSKSGLDKENSKIMDGNSRISNRVMNRVMYKIKEGRQRNFNPHIASFLQTLEIKQSHLPSPGQSIRVKLLQRKKKTALKFHESYYSAEHNKNIINSKQLKSHGGFVQYVNFSNFKTLEIL